VRLGVACVGIVAMLATSSCSGPDPQLDPSITTSPSAVSSPTPSATATPSATPNSPSPTPSVEPGDTGQTSSPPSVPTLKGASAQVSLATVDPSTGGLLVGGFVTGVFEDGGECTFSATPTSSGASQFVFTTGIANVDSTSCGTALIDSQKITRGTYEVVLTYRNHDGQVVSAPASVDIS